MTNKKSVLAEIEQAIKREKAIKREIEKAIKREYEKAIGKV